MIDLQLLAQNTDLFKQALAKKRFSGNLDELLRKDQNRRSILHELENLQAEQNKLSKEIASATPETRPTLLEQSKNLKEKLKELEPKLEQAETELRPLLLTIPNPPHESVPEGKDDTENVVIKTHGEKPTFTFTPKDHAILGKELDIIDIEAAANASGSRFYYLKGQGALLELAIINFVVQKVVSKGFKFIVPPVLVREKAMEATGFFPADRNEIYSVNPGEDDLYLVGTSEVPLAMLHADQIIDTEKLPLRYVGFSPCFRREAGTYGKDTQGILRVHQFNKVEMFSFCSPENSLEEHELIRSIEEEIMQDLGFHYQVLNICGGDLGAPAAKKYDIEAWIPTQEKFRELTSCSNCTDFQARRANIRSKKDGKTTPIHTLNGTAIATGRAIVAILENYQEADGSVRIPEVLRPFMANATHIKKN